MAILKIESTADGKLCISLTRFGDAELAALKAIPGHRWNPERKQWEIPDIPETRAALAEIVAIPPSQPPPMIAVRPKTKEPPSAKPYHRYIAGEGQPLTTNPPHPLLKQVDDELVLRGMAYGTRKSYGQHLRKYFDWLNVKRIAPEQATREHIRGYLVHLAQSGKVSAAYCIGFALNPSLLERNILCLLGGGSRNIEPDDLAP